MHRYDLTDAQWAIIEPFFPDRTHHGKAGHPWKDHRPLVNGILWHLHTGAPWPDVPERYGPWKTVYDRRCPSGTRAKSDLTMPGRTRSGRRTQSCG